MMTALGSTTALGSVLVATVSAHDAAAGAIAAATGWTGGVALTAPAPAATFTVASDGSMSAADDVTSASLPPRATSAEARPANTPRATSAAAQMAVGRPIISRERPVMPMSTAATDLDASGITDVVMAGTWPELSSATRRCAVLAFMVMRERDELDGWRRVVSSSPKLSMRGARLAGICGWRRSSVWRRGAFSDMKVVRSSSSAARGRKEIGGRLGRGAGADARGGADGRTDGVGAGSARLESPAEGRTLGGRTCGS